MKFAIAAAMLLALQACKHPLAIEGEGDIAEITLGERGCTLEEFQAQSPACSENEITGESYEPSYKAIPRQGWRFARWEGTACTDHPAPDRCDYKISVQFVNFINTVFPGFKLPPTRAKFVPDNLSYGPGYYQGLKFIHDGLEREYDLYVPSNYDGTSAYPLVVDAHGYNRSSNLQKLISGFDELAEREGFVVAYPQGVGNSWNIDTCCGSASATDVNDSGFLRSLVLQVQEDVFIDWRRVYATGWSNGGGIAARAVCDSNNIFAAMALFASLTQIGELCARSKPIPVMSLHATDDSVVPFNGGTFLGAKVLDQLEILDFWLELNQCTDSDSPEIQTLGSVTSCRIYKECRGGVETALCTTESSTSGGHDLYRNNDGVNLASRAWDFLSQFQLP